MNVILADTISNHTIAQLVQYLMVKLKTVKASVVTATITKEQTLVETASLGICEVSFLKFSNP